MKKELYVSPSCFMIVVNMEQSVLVASNENPDDIIDLPGVAGPPPMGWN